MEETIETSETTLETNSFLKELMLKIEKDLAEFNEFADNFKLRKIS